MKNTLKTMLLSTVLSFSLNVEASNNNPLNNVNNGVPNLMLNNAQEHPDTITLNGVNINITGDIDISEILSKKCPCHPFVKNHDKNSPVGNNLAEDQNNIMHVDVCDIPLNIIVNGGDINFRLNCKIDTKECELPTNNLPAEPNNDKPAQDSNVEEKH